MRSDRSAEGVKGQCFSWVVWYGFFGLSSILEELFFYSRKIHEL